MTATILLFVLCTAAAEGDAITAELLEAVATVKSLDIGVCTDMDHPQGKTYVKTNNTADLELLAKAMQFKEEPRLYKEWEESLDAKYYFQVLMFTEKKARRHDTEFTDKVYLGHFNLLEPDLIVFHHPLMGVRPNSGITPAMYQVQLKPTDELKQFVELVFQKLKAKEKTKGENGG